MILGIDASAAGSGGARRHIIEIINCFEPIKHGFSKILIWAPKDLLDRLPNSNSLIKCSHPFLNKGLLLRPLGNVFYIMPPYCILKNELKYAYKIIYEGLKKI